MPIGVRAVEFQRQAASSGRRLRAGRCVSESDDYHVVRIGIPALLGARKTLASRLSEGRDVVVLVPLPARCRARREAPSSHTYTFVVDQHR